MVMDWVESISVCNHTSEYDYPATWTGRNEVILPINHKNLVQFPRKEEETSYERKKKSALKAW